MPTPRKKSPLLLSLFFAIGLIASFALPLEADIIVTLNPDACTSTLTPGQVSASTLPSGNTTVYSTPGALAGNKVVMLVNGNGFGSASYTALASHLAQNGFIAAVFKRPGDSAIVTDLFDSIDEVLTFLGTSTRDPSLEIALVGHSKGGRVVIDGAKMNTTSNLGYPIGAVAALAPVASVTSWLDGYDTPAFLTIYGSQDEDTDAYQFATPNEAFYAYDSSGTEGSTTCNQPPCFATAPGYQKSMVFIYGADHAGLIGIGNSGSFETQTLDYLDPTDTLCITKAYLTGFLRWHLWGDSVYKGMLRGLWKPLSVLLIDTAEADGFGNPAGSPLRLFLQNSPVQHRTIQSFSGGLGSYTKTSQLAIQHLPAGTSSTSPTWIRHNTDMAAVGWDAASGSQWVKFAVPASSRQGDTYTHFSLRLGQLNGSPAPYTNATNTNQSAWIGLVDAANAISWHQITGIPAPDRYTAAGPTKAQSHLTTYRIPLSSITGVDTTDIRYVYLYFSSGTHGTLLVDSLEWHRD